MRARTLAAAPAAALALVAAPAAGAATSVEVKRSCFAEGGSIPVAGAGFTPNGPVTLTLERASGVLVTDTRPVAGADGTIAGSYRLENETGWFGTGETRFEMTLRLTDRRTSDASAIASFIFSRWNVSVRSAGGKLHPRRRARIRAFGFTGSIGRPLYVHWLRDGRRVHTHRLGRLRGPCGDVRARLPRGFPFRPVPAGRYDVRFSPSRTNTTKSTIRHRSVRVPRRIP